MDATRTTKTIGPGTLSDRQIMALHDAGHIVSRAKQLTMTHIQPASIDLPLGHRLWGLRAGFCPGREPIADTIASMALFELDLNKTVCVVPGIIYVAEIDVEMALPPNVRASFSPKSTTGRLDIFTRVLADGEQQFDTLSQGRAARLYIEISPRSFPVTLATGNRLCQARFRTGAPSDLPRTTLGVDLSGENGEVIGYEALRSTREINLAHANGLPASGFWRPIKANARRELILEPNAFYLLASKETVSVPPHMSAEMVAFDATLGEYRSQYAGYFDPGFGWTEGGHAPSHAVLEVRAHQMPFLLRDGQPVCRMGWELMSETPQNLYGQGRASYQGQRLNLPRLFDAAA